MFGVHFLANASTAADSGSHITSCYIFFRVFTMITSRSSWYEQPIICGPEWAAFVDAGATSGQGTGEAVAGSH